MVDSPLIRPGIRTRRAWRPPLHDSVPRLSSHVLKLTLGLEIAALKVSAALTWLA